MPMAAREKRGSANRIQRLTVTWIPALTRATPNTFPEGEAGNYTLEMGFAPEPTPTATPTAAPTATPTAAPTATPTAAPTATPTATPTVTPISTTSPTPTATPTVTPTPGLKMYQGSLSLHSFGNDTTAYVTPPFNAYVFTALPLGAHCNPAVAGGMTCATATLQMGAPLTGSGTALVGRGSPASIMLSSNQLGRITSGSFPQQYASVIYHKTYANLANAKGNLKPGGGPGNLTYLATPGLGARIFAGKNQFGGVMRLLSGAPSGGLGTKVRYTFSSSAYVGSFPTLGATLVGATSNGGFPAAGTVTGTVTHTTNSSFMSYVTAMVMGWPWTTGKVNVYAFGDYLAYSSLFPEFLSRSGYDNRTSQGGGTIQLVTPHLINWQGILQSGAIGVLRLKFVPEPPSGLVLLVGAGLLGVLYRRRNRW